MDGSSYVSQLHLLVKVRDADSTYAPVEDAPVEELVRLASEAEEEGEEQAERDQGRS